MKIKFSNLVKMFLAGACFVAVGCSDYSQDIENLNNRVNLLESNKIEPLKTDLDAVKSALESAKTDLQGKIDANTTSIAELDAALEEAKAANTKTIEGILEAVEALDGQIADLVDQDEQFAENILGLQAAFENLKADHDADKALFEATYNTLVEEFEAEKAKLEAEIKALQDKDVELQALIDGIDERLSTTETNLDKAIKDLNLLNEAYVALAGDFEQYQADIRAELDAHYAAFETYTAEALEKFSDLYAKHAEQEALIAANYDELSATDVDLQKSIDATNAAFEEYKNAMVEVVKGLEDKIAENKGAIEVNAQAINNLKEAIDGITSRLDEIESKLNALADYVYETITADIKALQGDLSALKGRIQSLVFVPNHKDGKATINHAELQYEVENAYTGFIPGWPWGPGHNRPQEPEVEVKSTFVECQSVLQFQVSPAECALALKNADELSFVLTGILAETRSAEEPTLDVVKVNLANDKKGIINVFVNARNLGEDFYKGAEYGASLVLKNELVNIASNYVNLTPASKAQIITVEMAEPAKTAYEIEWDSQDHVLVLPDQKFLFNIKGGDTKEEDITIEAMIEKGYNLEIKKETKVEPVKIVGGKNIFMNKTNTENPHYDYVYVNLDNADEKQARAAVGSVEKVTYNYNVAGAEFEATSTVEIVKISRTIEMRADNIVWNYHNDAASDAGILPTERVAAPATIKSFPQDVTVKYDDVVKLTPASVKVYAYGAERNDDPVLVENVVAKFGGTALKPTIDLKNFAWGETYKIEAVYDMPDLKIVISARATTEDRDRKEIVIKLEDAEWMLTEDFVNESETKAESFYEATYNALVASKVNHAYNNAFDKEKFMRDVFYTKDFTVDAVTANDVEMKSTKLEYLGDYKFKSVYNVTDFNPVPEKVEYVYAITTWYGQVIKFTKTLNLGLKTVELELEEYKIPLAKDLVFETKPESVAAIYDMVGAVDKANIDAETYLTKFFGNLRAKTYLANGQEMKNTVMFVHDDFTATARYSYEDFTETPKEVVYTSTYTTWYGQKVIITKKISIDWYIYDFKAIPEFVYEDGFYSIAKAHRVTDANNMLSGLEISLDLDTAFDVVTNEGERIAKADLEKLGLSTKFDFTTKPNDYEGIYIKGNKLYYHGYDETVGVKGQLILTNKNGVETVLTTKFDDVDSEYNGYYVKQVNPVNKMVAKPLTIKVPKHAKLFTYYLANQLSLTDDRGKELITPGEIVMDTDMALEYKNAAWTIGDGKNGFAIDDTVKPAKAAEAAEIYGLEYTFFYCDTKNVPALMLEKEVFTFDTETGKLVFDNRNDIELTKPIELEVTVGIRHSWTREETVSFKVLLQPETAPVEK